MANRLNLVQLMGNLGRDAELRYLSNGQPKVEFTLAVDDSYKPKGGGDWVEQTQWMNIVMWGDQAERMSDQLTKGTPVYVQGKIQNRSWDDDAGVKHYRTEIIANQVAVLVRPPKREEGQAPKGRQSRSESSEALPFE